MAWKTDRQTAGERVETIFTQKDEHLKTPVSDRHQWLTPVILLLRRQRSGGSRFKANSWQTVPETLC
jgi:hypothetical protein